MAKFILLALCLAVPAVSQTTPAYDPQGPSPAAPALTADSLHHATVPMGKLTDRLSLTSTVYDGMASDYWVYVPSQYDPDVPTPYMIFNDGAGYLDRKGTMPALNVLDNLIDQHKIPVMIAIFVNPGDITGSPETPTYTSVQKFSRKWSRPMNDAMRSVEYDTVSSRYSHFLTDELIPQVASQYNLRKDGYSHAITGSSSGGIAAFNAAWQQPEQFSRVISWIGSFTAIQWHEDPAVPDGGQDFPDKILHEEHRNIRVWLTDGSNDLEHESYGSWPLANIRMANALKLKSYDFRFTFGTNPHRQADSAVEFPQQMIWLWRDYKPKLESQDFVQDPAEAAKPPFRVSITNR
jgi:enterochelin esterase-like enzyme